MLLSFIIPYHNEPVVLLRQCLESIFALEWAHEEFEVLIVDDGSVESPLHQLSDLSSRVRYIHQPNQGLSVARNTGIAHAVGDFLQFVDADDYLIASEYNHVLGRVRQRVSDIISFRFTHTHPRTLPVRSQCCSGVDYMLSHNLRGAAWAYVFRRSLLGTLRFCKGIYHEDELFTPQLFLRAQRVESLLLQAYYYRQRVGTITRTPDRDHIRKRLDDFEYVVRELSVLRHSLRGEQGWAMQRKVSQLSMDYLYNVVRLTGSMAELWRRRESLRAAGLYPLPIRCYTWKYALCSLFTHVI